MSNEKNTPDDVNLSEIAGDAQRKFLKSIKDFQTSEGKGMHFELYVKPKVEGGVLDMLFNQLLEEFYRV